MAGSAPPIPHGRACMNCARAKAKCTPDVEGGKCSRYVYLRFCSMQHASKWPTSSWGFISRTVWRIIAKVLGRCERLNKQCLPGPSLRRQQIVKKPSNNVTRLEEKLDGLYSLLKSGVQPTVTAAGTSTATSDSPALIQQSLGLVQPLVTTTENGENKRSNQACHPLENVSTLALICCMRLLRSSGFTSMSECMPRMGMMSVSAER